MNKIDIKETERKAILNNLKKVQGQIKAIVDKVEANDINDGIFTQLLAIKGGASRACKDLISKGVLPNIKSYSAKELDQALSIILMLDK